MRAGQERINILPLLSSTPTRIKVTGLSMLPFLEEGDGVFVVSAKQDNLEEGDLIVFRRGEESIVHRVIKIKRGSFYEMGDNQRFGSWVSLDQSLAKVISVEKMNGEKTDMQEGGARKKAKRILLLQRVVWAGSACQNGAGLWLFSSLAASFFRALEYLIRRTRLN